MVDKLMPIRFLLIAPFAFVGLFFFACYFSLRNTKYGDNKVFMAIPALIFGLPSAISNALWNIFGATFVYWELPPTTDPDDGSFSIFFTNRLKTRLKKGQADPMTRWFVWAVAQYDPDHFEEGFNGIGTNPYV